MQRRRFLAGAPSVGLGAIAGCAGSTEPDMTGLRTVRPDPYVVTTDTEETEYFGTIHNRGYDGNVRVELWFFKDESIPSPSTSHLFNNINNPQRTFDVARSFFYSEDERREVSITAVQLPSEWKQREFGLLPVPATYGAIFENEGASGDIEVKLKFDTPGIHDVEEPSRKLMTVDSGEEVEVMFEIVIPEGLEYEITAEPA